MYPFVPYFTDSEMSVCNVFLAALRGKTQSLSSFFFLAVPGVAGVEAGVERWAQGSELSAPPL